MTDATQSHPPLARKGLTAEILRTLVRYEPDTGTFIRLASPRRAAGKLLNKPAAPYRNTNGYTLISLGRTWRFRAHHLAWLWMTGAWPTNDVDHMNGDRSDNRWNNLRAATRSQNLQNMGLRSDNKTGIKGVSFDARRQRWVAQIKVGDRRIHLGRHQTPELAADAYASAARANFGEFARLESA